MNMKEINWGAFNAKFNGREQSSFEWLCYIIFCIEFRERKGVFRYKNQSGIETNPIVVGNDLIGWQSKYYYTPLSKHKNDLLETIRKSKRDYKNITKIIFFINIEWGQAPIRKETKKDISDNDPTAKKDVEKEAEQLGIKIEWRTASFFESPFITIDNTTIVDYFFSLDKGLCDLLEEKNKHTENIFLTIKTNIDFNSYKIEINRDDILNNLEEKLIKEQVIILSGVGGVGKTSLIKNIFNKLKNNTPFYVFKASEFNVNDVNVLFNKFTLQDFIFCHKDEKTKVVVIDSSEKLLDLQNREPFKEFVSALVNANWRIIFTTRSSYLLDLYNEFVDNYQVTPAKFNIDNLSKVDLEKLSVTYNFLLPEDLKLLDLIKNPFYLNEYLKYYKQEDKIDYPGFKEKLWNTIIKKSKPNREQCFLQIAFQRAKEGNFFVTSDYDSDMLTELLQDGVLGYETAGYFITHDIYEEWALENIIESEFIKKESNKKFFEEIGETLPIRRSFRNWLSEKLLLKNESIKQFIEEIFDEGVDHFWNDEILISVLLSDYSETFFEYFEKKLLEDNQELLKKITFLLRIACKEVDGDVFKKFGIKNIDILSIEYVLTKPKGQGWNSVIKFVYDNLNEIGIKNINFILPIIHDWNSKFKEGEIAKLSSLIALQYYQWIIREDIYFSRDNGVKEKVLQSIVYGSLEIKNELKEIFEDIIKNKWKSHKDPYHDLSKFILTKLEGISVCKILPTYILQLANLFWTSTHVEDDFYHRSSIDIEQHFGIEKDRFNYYPASSYQTPIYWLLQFSLKETIVFILEFTNRAVINFSKSDFSHELEEIEIFIEEDKSFTQYISNRLWCMYRGTQVSPNILESMHMALEKFFLENGKNTDSKTLEY